MFCQGKKKEFFHQITFLWLVLYWKKNQPWFYVTDISSLYNTDHWTLFTRSVIVGVCIWTFYHMVTRECYVVVLLKCLDGWLSWLVTFSQSQLVTLKISEKICFRLTEWITIKLCLKFITEESIIGETWCETGRDFTLKVT